jgi:putative phosphoesterase
MRIGVVSDIHCDHESLARALAAMDGVVDRVWCAGDIVIQYRFCDITTRLLREADAVAIRGNHDAAVTKKATDSADAGEVAWLAALPFEHREEIDGCALLMTHGSPWEPHGDYISARNAKWQRADELGVDIVVVGHLHEPMVQTFGTTLVVNPGSLGEPRQRDDRRGTYAVIDTATRTATIEYV